MKTFRFYKCYLEFLTSDAQKSNKNAIKNIFELKKFCKLEASILQQKRFHIFLLRQKRNSNQKLFYTAVLISLK